MDGFLLHLQNEQKEAVIKEEPHLHIYSSNDVDMWVLYTVSNFSSVYLFMFYFLIYFTWRVDAQMGLRQLGWIEFIPLGAHIAITWHIAS